ncbi:hypothetical protein RRG08_062173 [Elysia crispata]|uniref:Uncharacterized protein n=1 Tax=Elysia crispata TaxID=231223 RepID=A0AAE0Z021_9GAST|nr:hypothetical protein RRG08_062173 [Elysia crispata]
MSRLTLFEMEERISFMLISDYGTSKPVVIGEFNKKNGGGRSFKQLFDYAYGHGYAGAWSWDLVSKGRDERSGISLLKDHTENGKIPIHIYI